MKLRVTVTDTGETLEFAGDDKEASERFIGNCLATMAVSRKEGDTYVGPVVEIRWVESE